MRILELRIENFGGLHDLTLPLEGGLNLLLRENGWGKSTLMAFIRVMFFGFDGEQKRNIEENERKRYRPWQGGVYGGSILFQTGEKIYRIERSFGERREDRFSLYDAKTGLLSGDYSERIGEELFQIDRDSFSKSLFTGQLEAETEATAGIHAKIGNLAAEEADMSQYERAQKILKKQMDFLTPKRKTGRLSRLKDEIQRLEYEIRLLSEEKKSLEVSEKQRQALEKEICALAEERKLLQRELLSRGKQLEAEVKEREKKEQLEPDAFGQEAEDEDREPLGRGALAGFFLAALLLLAGFFLTIRWMELGGIALFLLSAGLLLKKTGEPLSDEEDRDRDAKRKGFAEKSQKEDASEAEKRKKPGSEQGMEELAGRLEALDRRLERLEKEKEEKRALAESWESSLEKRLQKQESLDAKREEEKELRRKYAILELTGQSLENARIRFSTRYLEGVKESFDHYYQLIAGKGEADFFLDANLDLRCRKQGELRDIRLMSRGYRDLIGICRRMAFLDAMYEKEKPPLFFDDPFAGLDEEKLEGGMNLLEEIADRYQVIYLTCHKDRI